VELMSVTLSVQSSMTYVQTLIDNQRLNVNNMEPGVTMANTVLGTMMGPPFTWRQNRSNLSINLTTLGGTDYIKSVPTMGFIETQWLTDSDGNILELNGATALAKVSFKRTPTLIAPQYDDNAGNITFRVNSVPDVAYTAFLDFQNAAPIITSPANTFLPLSDYFGYLFNKGMLSEGALLVNDSRFSIWRSEWIAQCLATQDGLDAQAKDMFYNQFMNTTRTVQRSQAMSSNGGAGRTR
jgi:hypothetical protein